VLLEVGHELADLGATGMSGEEGGGGWKSTAGSEVFQRR
jgi:hypothetical protein